MMIKVRKTQARCDFEDIPPGTYALKFMSNTRNENPGYLFGLLAVVAIGKTARVANMSPGPKLRLTGRKRAAAE
jgi:hypothetical protein